MFYAQSTNTVTSGRIQFVIITKLLSGRVKFVVTTKLISGRIKFVVITKLLSGRINFVVPTKLFVNATEHKNWVNPWIQQLAGETKKKQENVNERVMCSITRSVPLHSHGFDLANIFLNGLPRNQQQKSSRNLSAALSGNMILSKLISFSVCDHPPNQLRVLCRERRLRFWKAFGAVCGGNVTE